MKEEKNNTKEQPETVHSGDEIGTEMPETVEVNTGQLKVNLGNFEGPLDLLLHLVKDAKIEIKDIFLSKVTEQFLQYMNQLNTIDVDLASEYMATAATLMEIKSHSLLPTLMEFDDSKSPEKEFVRDLEEYARFKEISEKLKTQETVDRLYKPFDEGKQNVRFVAKDMSLDSLLDAFARILHKVDKAQTDPNEKKIQRDEFSVADKIIYIQDALNKRQSVVFSDFFDDDATKMEIVVTFSAMLELLKFQFIVVKQSDSFEEIFIEKNPNYNDVLADDLLTEVLADEEKEQE